ncbi:hypothetical protein V8D89_000133, partial [Ganoderma adspersum]
MLPSSTYSDSGGDVYMLTDARPLLPLPIVFTHGFNLADKLWLEFNTNHAGWNNEAFVGPVL